MRKFQKDSLEEPLNQLIQYINEQYATNFCIQSISATHFAINSCVISHPTISDKLNFVKNDLFV